MMEITCWLKIGALTYKFKTPELTVRIFPAFLRFNKLWFNENNEVHESSLYYFGR